METTRRNNRTNFPLTLFPLNRSRRFAGDIVHHAVDVLHLGDDAAGDFFEHGIGDFRGFHSHGVLGGDGAQGHAIAVGAAIAHDADGADTAAGEGRLVTIPVCYGGDFGPDLPFVAQHAGLTEEEVIALHAGREYQIYMLGFLPGFPYLGGLDERLFTPRLGTPRTAIPAGAVGIGGEQTGIYPIASPGGWQLIGRTPLKLFDPASGTLPYAAGDRIRFTPITAAEFVALAAKEGTV